MTMHRLCLLGVRLGLLLAAGMMLHCTAVAAADLEPVQGVLLLRNGQMIEGQISRTDDHYQVNLPYGEIRVRLADVEFCCRTLQEGYERKRAAIQVGNVQDHLELAQWCERHGLLDLAANELSAAAAIEPNHPMVGVLRRRLQLAREPPLQPSESSGGVASPTADELDRMVRGMPPGAVETFAQIVQPLLINHCTSSGCHGPQSETRFRLMRTPVSQPAGRRLTQRNLQAVLEYVDYNAPSSSRLLTVVSGPHGPVRAGTFSDRQAGQYKRIADWVNLVTRQPAGAAPLPTIGVNSRAKPAAPAAEESTVPRTLTPAALRARQLASPSREGKGGVVRQTSAAESRQFAARRQEYQEHSARPQSKTSPGPHLPPKRGSAEATAAAEADPFDPELFNRQNAPAKPDAAGSASGSRERIGSGLATSTRFFAS